MTHAADRPDRPVVLHLQIRAAPGKGAELIRFLQEATPVYERPGGIRVRLLQSLDDPSRFIEVIEYADRAAYDRDQVRVASDPEMQAYLSRWHALLEGPVTLVTYGDLTEDIHDR